MKYRAQAFTKITLGSLTALMAFTGAFACKSPLEAFTGPGVHILFIGNSLTYTNDLPKTLSDMFKAGGKEMSYLSVAEPNFALIDHLNSGSDAVDQIKRGGWDFVILQQGPSSTPENRQSLIEWTKQFNQHIANVKARAALYMVWPDKTRLSFFEDVRVSYKSAADSVNGLFLPAGEAWLTAWQEEQGLALYGPDDFHPSVLGTYLAALVIYEQISGADARELPGQATVAGNTLGTPELTVRLLQNAAHTTNERYAGN
ncbi:MAG: hypothetical protein L0Y80_07745 [Ignavibacteriae bacterium]|nr:hypothetical protein [Ignavibacteriota bacterium]